MGLTSPCLPISGAGAAPVCLCAAWGRGSSSFPRPFLSLSSNTEVSWSGGCLHLNVSGDIGDITAGFSTGPANSSVLIMASLDNSCGLSTVTSLCSSPAAHVLASSLPRPSYLRAACKLDHCSVPHARLTWGYPEALPNAEGCSLPFCRGHLQSGEHLVCSR